MNSDASIENDCVWFCLWQLLLPLSENSWCFPVIKYGLVDFFSINYYIWVKETTQNFS